MVEGLLTLDELVDILKVPKSWVYGRIHAKNLPFDTVRIGHYLRFPESSVRAYLERATTKAQGGEIVEIRSKKMAIK